VRKLLPRAIRFTTGWGPVGIWMAAVFLSSSVPGSRVPFAFPYQDIVAHLFLYYILAFLTERAMRGSFPLASRQLVVIAAFLWAVVYGVLDEAHQLLVPLRNSSILDMFVNACGASIRFIKYPWRT
jgi:VanZ family protein